MQNLNLIMREISFIVRDFFNASEKKIYSTSSKSYETSAISMRNVSFIVREKDMRQNNQLINTTSSKSHKTNAIYLSK